MYRNPLALVALLAALIATPVAAQVSIILDPPVAPLGQPVRITVANGPAWPIDSIEMWPHVTGPNIAFGPPPPPPGSWPMAPNTSRGWTWNQRHYLTSQPVGPGVLTVGYSYWLRNGPLLKLSTKLVIDDIDLRVRVAAPRGSTLPLALRAPKSAQMTYQVALSLRDAPGIRITGGRLLTLAPDGLFLLSLAGAPGFTGFSGTLDAAGNGAASIAIPQTAALTGLRVFAAFVTISNTFPVGVHQYSYRKAFVIR